MKYNTDKQSFFDIFTFINEKTYEGVPGVWCIDSGKTGPTLGITINTHGNEPSGLAGLAYLHESLHIENVLTQGRLFIVLNNIEATRKYFEATTDEERKKCRFLDVNMNRLPKEDVISEKHHDAYEINRARELLPIWRKFDIGFDIHSMSQDGDPMILSIGELHSDLIRGFPIDIIISNLEEIQVGTPAMVFYGSKKIPVLGIESGSHESEKAFEVTRVCIRSLLLNLHMIDGSNDIKQHAYRHYKVKASLLFPDDSYALAEEFKTYEPVQKGRILATGDGTPLVSPIDGHILFGGPKGKKAASLSEEVLFISEPVKEIFDR